MNKRQKIAIVAPPLLVAVMIPVFQLLSGVFEDWRLGWYLGLAIYWLIWGAAFSTWMIGKETLRELIQPQRPTKSILLLVAFPLLMSALYRLGSGMAYEKTSAWILLLLLSTTFGNAFFEELLWRGVYMKLFPASTPFRIIWPSIWFAIWHYAPGSVSPDNHVIGLIVGSGFFGFYLSFLAKKTNTLWWCMVSHTLGGMIMVG